MAKILIIDDDEIIREMMLQVLAKAGHAVVAAQNGFEGVSRMRTEPVDLVITDLNMPYGGLQTIRVLRTEFPALRIIAMSGAGTARLEIARSQGANHILGKPCTTEELVAVVASAFA